MKIKSLFSLHPPSADGRIINYGTAGFRDVAKCLGSIVMHSGILAALRSRHQKSAAVGLIITASHNPSQDNGIKIIDVNGEMLTIQWEDFACKLANCQEADETANILQSFAAEMKIDLGESIKSHVLIARDTRPSGSSLATAAKNGASLLCLSEDIEDLGLLTTPQLHFVVKCKNDPSYGTASESGYYAKLASAFKCLVAMMGRKEVYQNSITLDCANGIGSLKMKPLLNAIDIDSVGLSVSLENTDIDSPEKLNANCGADYVKLHCKTPQGFEHQVNTKYVSFDGDADRIIYYYLNSEGQFKLVDGDKIAILFCYYLQKLLKDAQLLEEMSFSLVQTAYANGASTLYAQDVLNVKSHCVPTGVKHLHHQAKKFDISVYFEANGHGTMLFSDEATTKIRSLEGNTAAKKLSHLIDLTNQTSGDAISDFLLVEVILRDLDWSIEKWDSLYTDLSSKQLKVSVIDRSKVTTTNAERTVVTPVGLQSEIDAAVRLLGPRSRCFVRPSGTEDVVRVYAEAETIEKATSLANSVAASVQVFVNGATDGDK